MHAEYPHHLKDEEAPALWDDGWFSSTKDSRGQDIHWITNTNVVKDIVRPSFPVKFFSLGLFPYPFHSVQGNEFKAQCHRECSQRLDGTIQYRVSKPLIFE